MNPQEIAAFFQRVIASPTASPVVKAQVAAFMTSGTMPTDPEAVRVVQDGLTGTPFADAPGTFYTALRGAVAPGGAGAGQGGIAEAVQAGTPPAPGIVPPPLGSGQAAASGAIGNSILAQARAAAQKAASGPYNANSVSIDDGNPTGATTSAVRPPAATGGGVRPESPLNNGAIPFDRPVANNGALPLVAGGAVPGAGASTTAGPGFNFSTGTGDPASQGVRLSEDDDMMIQFALRAAGFNPERMTGAAKSAGRALLPLLRSARGAFGIAGDNTVDKLPDFLKQMAGSFTAKGGNFFQNARGLAESTMGSSDFQNAIAGLSDEEAVQAMYKSLMPLQYAGSNPLIQQSAADTFQRQQDRFNWLDAGFTPDPSWGAAGPAVNQQAPGGIFRQWLADQGQALDPISRRIFGMR